MNDGYVVSPSCWRGCPIDTSSGLQRHQYPCEQSGNITRLGSLTVIDITGGLLSPDEQAIHAKYQSDDPDADYYDTCPARPGDSRSETR